MYQPDYLLYSIDDERLRTFVQGLLDTVKEQSAQIEKQAEQIGRLARENEQLHAEIRHLKKHKGKPKIRPNVATQDDQDTTALPKVSDHGQRHLGKLLRHRLSSPEKKHALSLIRDRIGASRAIPIFITRNLY